MNAQVWIIWSQPFYVEKLDWLISSHQLIFSVEICFVLIVFSNNGSRHTDKKLPLRKHCRQDTMRIHIRCSLDPEQRKTSSVSLQLLQREAPKERRTLQVSFFCLRRLKDDSSNDSLWQRWRNSYRPLSHKHRFLTLQHYFSLVRLYWSCCQLETFIAGCCCCWHLCGKISKQPTL